MTYEGIFGAKSVKEGGQKEGGERRKLYRIIK